MIDWQWCVDVVQLKQEKEPTRVNLAFSHSPSSLAWFDYLLGWTSRELFHLNKIK